MKRLQDFSIQSKLVGIFAAILLVGVLVIAWNVVNINNSKRDITDVLNQNKREMRQALDASKVEVAQALDASKEAVAQALNANRENVAQVLDTSMEDATDILDRLDALIILQIIEIEFREMEALEKELVMYNDTLYLDEIVADYQRVDRFLERDLAFAVDNARDDEMRQLVLDLQEQRIVLNEMFDEIVALKESDPDEARYLSDETTAVRAAKVYNALAGTVITDWQTTFDDSDETWSRVQTTIDQTGTDMQAAIGEAEAQMQIAVDETDAQMQAVIDRSEAQLEAAIDRTESNLQTAINVSLVTIMLFITAGAIVAATVVIVSRQIVRPVMTMADVAESIEKEEFQTEKLDGIVDRKDEIGVLARVFQRMAQEVDARMEKLKQQVAQLKIVIDERKLSDEVSEITDTDYFRALQSKAKSQRRRDRTKRRSSSVPAEGE